RQASRSIGLAGYSRRPMPKRSLVLAALLALFAAGCGGDDEKGKTASTATTAAAETTSTAAQEKDSAGCVVTAAPKPRGPGKEKKPKLQLSPSKDYTVTLKTNCGAIDIALDVKRAPKTSSSFASLV